MHMYLDQHSHFDSSRLAAQVSPSQSVAALHLSSTAVTLPLSLGADCSSEGMNRSRLGSWGKAAHTLSAHCILTHSMQRDKHIQPSSHHAVTVVVLWTVPHMIWSKPSHHPCPNNITLLAAGLPVDMRGRFQLQPAQQPVKRLRL